jgi:hypothetical protein
MIAMHRVVRMACVTAAAVLLLAAVAAGQPQTTKKQVKGKPTVTTESLSGDVVQVEGNDLVVKLSSGEVKTFHVPPTRKFLIDGHEVGVGDLKPGTKLVATVRTTSTPVMVRTRSTISGKVWYVMPPSTIILTLASGENKQYTVQDDIRFVVDGHPATVFDLKPGMWIDDVLLCGSGSAWRRRVLCLPGLETWRSGCRIIQHRP